MVIVGLQLGISKVEQHVCLLIGEPYALCLRPPGPGSGETPLGSAMIQVLVRYGFRRLSSSRQHTLPGRQDLGRILDVM